jgi:hypothetical protein
MEYKLFKKNIRVIEKLHKYNNTNISIERKLYTLIRQDTTSITWFIS